MALDAREKNHMKELRAELTVRGLILGVLGTGAGDADGGGLGHESGYVIAPCLS